MEKIVDKKAQGKKNKAAGRRFELKVRKDLESKGWIVSKWMNNVEFDKDIKMGYGQEFANKIFAKLIPAKHKFRGPGIPMAIGTGFPDFVAFIFYNYAIPTGSTKEILGLEIGTKRFAVLGIEVKSNGYLDKIEKEKCRWYLDNNIFSKILIARKGKKRGEIEYVDFK